MTKLKTWTMVNYYTNLERMSVTLSLLAMMVAKTSLTTSFSESGNEKLET
jgi:hypothetical protein